MTGGYASGKGKDSTVKKRNVLRSIAGYLLVMLIAAGSFCSTCAYASDNPTYMVGKTGSLELTMKYKDSGAEKPMHGGKLAIYLVGAAADNNGNQYFDVTQGKFASNAEVKKIPDMDSSKLDSQNAAISKALDKIAGNAKADKEQAIQDGKVKFTDLPAGLYFVKQTAASDEKLTMPSFLISVPDSKGNLEVTASPKTSVSKPPKTTPPPDTPNNPPPKTTTPPPKLPQTGQLWWPVPFLAAGGILLILIGILKRMRAANMA